jgi:HSP20 family protein
MTTTLVWSPLGELDSMEHRMRRLFDGIGFAPALLPPSDVYETPDEFVVELEVPGFEREELGIEVSDHQLTVKGEHKETTDESEKAFRVRERLESDFERRFRLPSEADTEHVQAKFLEGVLEVHTPKLVASQPKQIEITRG